MAASDTPDDKQSGHAEQGGDASSAEGAPDVQLNPSLDVMLDRMVEEVERLKTSLEFFRLSDHPDKDNRIRWHVQEIDRRQDAIEDLKVVIMAGLDRSEH